MRILGIETSCDETAIAVVEWPTSDVDQKNIGCLILSNVVSSQVKVHKKWGGVVPMLAKREHQKNLAPVLLQALEEAGLLKLKTQNEKRKTTTQNLKNILTREPELLKQFLKIIPTIEPPDIDAIAVTYGPGLEPALWVGVNFARALAILWKKPLIPIDHMEGHIAAALQNQKVKFPALALLVSGAHTQLVLIKKMFDYQIIGTTLDDAVGEAFDKVARMLGLGYPGGPVISALAEIADKRGLDADLRGKIKLPRPMLKSGNFDFSFSGLKTAVLYKLREFKKLTPKIKREIAHEFQESVKDVFLKKTLDAASKYKVKTIILGGGVSANKQLREAFPQALIPPPNLATDNGAMIALAALLRLQHKKTKKTNPELLHPNANLKLS